MFVPSIRVLLFLLRLGLLVEAFVCEKKIGHCETSLVIDNAFTMIHPDHGPVYAKDRALFSLQHGDEIDIKDVITADGWNITRKLLTVNGSMPGPSIFLYQNQVVTIFVKNNLINEGVTIHWHGIDQLGWPAMDGVAFVTQCPILPGQSFNYTFQPRFSGTYWYHSHMGNQRDMGLYGAFIVLKTDNEIPIPQQHIIQLMEWNHLYDPVTLLKAKGIDKAATSILINGRGEFQDNKAPLETFSLDKDERHLFRIIGVGSMDVLLFSVPGLRLIVKETDGYPFVPKIVDEIIIYPAERYDFKLDLDHANEGIYNITIYILEDKSLKKRKDIVGLGFINITNFHNHFSVYLNGTARVILNCPFKKFPNEPNITCLPVSELSSRNTTVEDFDFDVQSVPRSGELSTHFLNFGFPGKTGYSSINGRKFIWPTVSALTQPSDLDTSCSGCADETSCECTHSINLKTGSEIIVVLSNVGNGAFISHPIHMHGHTFEVLKMGFPAVENAEMIPNDDIQCSQTLFNNKSQCNNARWRNSSWNDYKNIPGINLVDAVRKDTIIVPYGGYAVIRIWATNPGVWFMHCHIDRHMAEGMAVMLNESFEMIKNLPNGLPTCHSFRNSNPMQQDLPPSTTDLPFWIILGVAGFLFIVLMITFVVLQRMCKRGARIVGVEQQEMTVR